MSNANALYDEDTAVLDAEMAMVANADEEGEVETNDELDLEAWYGTKQMRWYQIAARTGVIKAIGEGAMRVLLEMPTGTGKTLSIAAILGDPRLAKIVKAVDRRVRVLFVAHNHRLLTQAERTFLADSNVELITQSMFSPIPDDVVRVGWDICVLDECHHEACATFQHQLDKIGVRPLIGLTATKDRADNVMIKFDVIINPISREQAVAEGYLAETDLFTIIDPTRGSKVQIFSDVLNHYGHLFGQTLAFFKTKKEVREATAMLVAKGYKAIAVLDQTPTEVDAILDAFGRKEHQYVVSCNKLSEGIDVVGCDTEFLGRTYGSYPNLNQVVGRAARPDSDCKIFELVNPLAKRNLDTTVITGVPRSHKLLYTQRGQWMEETFDYSGTNQAFSMDV